MPVYNEEKSIRDVISKALQLEDVDILVVDDASKDRTTEMILDFKNDRIKILRHPINMGYGTAIRTGLKWGLSKGYELFLIMDADGQHLPEEFSKLFPFVDKFDIVLGSRFSSGFKSTYRIPFLRKLGMIFFSHLIMLITFRRIYDTTTGFQVFNRKTACILKEIYPYDFPDAEVILKLMLLNLRVKEVPVRMLERESGTSMIGFLKSIYYPFRQSLGIISFLIYPKEKKEVRKLCF